MTTQKYSLNVTYRLGKQLVLADTISRTYLPEYGESIEEKFDINILQTLPISDIKLHQLKEETKKDPQLQQLSSVIATGRPRTKRDIPAKCLPYWNQQNNTKEPMVAHEISTRRWSQVGADLFEISNQKYLIITQALLKPTCSQMAPLVSKLSLTVNRSSPDMESQTH